MSFEPNDINKTIHLGNYEEFFILYIDNELNEEQKQMVNAFLLAQPDLQEEFDILMSTKLHSEPVSFDKRQLFAENMKLSSLGEELLLYVDNELPADKNKIIEWELASNKDYQLQYETLLRTKLDPSDRIVYPNKEELYRTTEQIISIKPWMRVAAAAIIIAVGGMLYFQNSSPSVAETPTLVKTNNPVRENVVKANDSAPKQQGFENSSDDGQLANKNSPRQRNESEEKSAPERQLTNEIVDDLVAVNNNNSNSSEEVEINRVKVTDIQVDDRTVHVVATNLNKDFINSPDVTSVSSERTNEIDAVDPEGPMGDNNFKGSVKGFLRKATRMIEKRTGINPTDEDGKLLIGSVAINLK